MRSFREVRDFHEEHGHAEVARVLGDELMRWCEATAALRRDAKISPKRLAYLDELENGA